MAKGKRFGSERGRLSGEQKSFQKIELFAALELGWGICGQRTTFGPCSNLRWHLASLDAEGFPLLLSEPPLWESLLLIVVCCIQEVEKRCYDTERMSNAVLQ